jgi:TfoX/Sxy family transcriptional regulator of competence genes
MLAEGVDDKSLEVLSKFGEIRLKERMFGGGIIFERRNLCKEF